MGSLPYRSISSGAASQSAPAAAADGCRAGQLIGWTGSGRSGLPRFASPAQAGPRQPHPASRCCTGASRASTSFMLARAHHVDPRRGTGVNWHLSGRAARTRHSSQTLEPVKHHLKPKPSTIS
jgi:hypothetical protein